MYGLVGVDHGDDAWEGVASVFVIGAGSLDNKLADGFGLGMGFYGKFLGLCVGSVGTTCPDKVQGVECVFCELHLDETFICGSDFIYVDTYIRVDGKLFGLSTDRDVAKCRAEASGYGIVYKVESCSSPDDDAVSVDFDSHYIYLAILLSVMSLVTVLPGEPSPG